MAGTVGSECMAQHRLDGCIAAHNVLSGLAARILAFGDAVHKSGRCLRDSTKATLSSSRMRDVGPLSQNPQETVCVILKPGKHLVQILVS